MAANTIDLNTMNVPAAYTAAANLIPLTQGLPEENWSDDKKGAIPIWHVIPLDDNNTVTVGAEFLQQISNNTISVKTAINCFKLAMSLKSPDTGVADPLLSQADRPAAATANPTVLAREEMPASDTFPNTPYTLQAPQVVPGPAPAVILPVANAAAAAHVAVVPQAGEDTQEEKRYAYCFIAAYLMKLLVKSADNVVTGLTAMRTRYEGFYGPARTVATFSLSQAQAIALKKGLASREKIMVTYTMALAHTQSQAAGTLGTREMWILSYLGFLPFSYNGLHAYTLLIDLKNFSKVPLGKLMSLFHVNITAPALSKIAYIVQNLERTTDNPNRDVYFRYCSSWGPQYFQSLRSRHCTHLLYTVAWAWKTIAPGHPNADPENIAAISSLSRTMKTTLKQAGIIIGESLKKN
ncbi:uncharacterized protein [Nicotiana tomentosiformis]|uniref:uncharacterized protein n=1 Tax=Nicotiana tomentosiformis TaxID=4098 RepID=UPI00051B79FD|nr:uncharacterized protein LOC104114166 [Nicotiana tomentosiformis]